MRPTWSNVAQHVRRAQLDLGEAVSLLETRHLALHVAVSASLDRINQAATTGPVSASAVDDAHDVLRGCREPMDEAIREVEGVLELLDDLDRELLAYG